MADIVHGRNAYTARKCRCDICRESHREYQAGRRAEMRAYAKVHGLPSSVSHGVSAYQNWACRCEVCTTATRLADRRKRREASRG